MYELRTVSDIVTEKEYTENNIEISVQEHPDVIYEYVYFDGGYFVFQCMNGPCVGSYSKFPANYVVIQR